MNSGSYAAKEYAVFIAVMNSLEVINWAVGMSFPNKSTQRPWIFLVMFGFVLMGKIIDSVARLVLVYLRDSNETNGLAFY